MDKPTLELTVIVVGSIAVALLMAAVLITFR